MICNKGTYLYSERVFHLLGTLLLLLCCLGSTAQDQRPVKDSITQKRLLYYHSFTSSKPAHPYTKIDYTRPNDQLMSWPNFPLTATEMERRHRVAEKEEKLSSVIAKDIITNLLKKKPRIAVIPKF